MDSNRQRYLWRWHNPSCFRRRWGVRFKLSLEIQWWKFTLRWSLVVVYIFKTFAIKIHPLPAHQLLHGRTLLGHSDKWNVLCAQKGNHTALLFYAVICFILTLYTIPSWLGHSSPWFAHTWEARYSHMTFNGTAKIPLNRHVNMTWLNEVSKRVSSVSISYVWCHIEYITCHYHNFVTVHIFLLVCELVDVVTSWI